MKTIACMNMKGGVGKTTLSVNLAYAVAYWHGKKVLLVDIDPQFNATQCLITDDVYIEHLDAGRSTVLDIFMPKRQGPINTVQGTSVPIDRSSIGLRDVICPIASNLPKGGSLDLLPSTLNLLEVESAPRQTELRLRNFLQQKAVSYDFIFLDCPPTISFFTQAAILCSDSYLVPIRPDPLSVLGLPLLERWLEGFVEVIGGGGVNLIGLVFSLVRNPPPNQMQSVMDDLRAQRPKQVFAAELHQATDVASAVAVRQPVFLYKPASKAAQQVKAISDEFITRTAPQ